MITIMPADKAFLESINAPEGVEALVLRDSRQEISGHALFRLQGQEVELLGVVCDEPLLVDGLIRSVLNAGDYRGATDGLCRVESLAPHLQRLEFQPTEDGWRVSLEAFFRAGCSGEDRT
ncbi:MAG: hypothetical protein E7541_05870 [Ruminococcaceae bacterium]|nr:hypothetical protein [Oscillospiraceae bacterium]